MEYPEIGEWLMSNRLDMYIEKMKDSGYEYLCDIVKMSEEEMNDMFSHVGMAEKPGHISRFKLALKSIIGAVANPPEVESQPTAETKTPKLPENVKPMLFPNPFSHKLLFYNELVYQLYEESYNLLPGLSWKEYVKQQQHHRWVLKLKVDGHVQKIGNLTDLKCKDGAAMNVERYQTMPKDINVVDVKRAERTKDTLTSVANDVRKTREEISNLRSELFHPETLVVKSHQCSQVEFYDQMLEKLDLNLQLLMSKLDNVSYTHSALRTNFFPSAVNSANEKRIKRRRKEQTRKTKRRNEKKVVENANKLSKLLNGPSDMFVNYGEKAKVKLCAENLRRLDHQKLLPRFHLKALQYMIEQDAFDADAIESANNICHILKVRQETKPEKRPIKKVKTAETTSVLNYFKLIPGTSVEDKREEIKNESESDPDSDSSNQDSDFDEIDLK